ncbi:hypothetical protein B0T19DRAFT_445971 [Cercophora scortea]|uniref:Pantetheine-phosphate adenylyltransferase n=1 Tax=Cercophora scortea TaxID=314031 RepID=A0AAE0I7Y3_9PEZI|nr:hypothetical protein B0T19DRAFT_445971 [Cercophora scortea]
MDRRERRGGAQGEGERGGKRVGVVVVVVVGDVVVAAVDVESRAGDRERGAGSGGRGAGQWMRAARCDDESDQSPRPSSRPLLDAAYRPSLTAALSKLRSSKTASRLIVAVACPVLQGQFRRSKTRSWPEAQSLIAGIYTLLSVISAQLSIDTEIDGGPGSVDATVVLIDHSRSTRFDQGSRPAIQTNNTIVVDLATFALAYHPWNYIFHVRSEPGLELYQTYLKLAEGKQTLLHEQLVPVEGGLALNVASKDPSATPTQTPGQPVVCLGGTFDYLHPGHKLLLTAGALLLEVPEKDSGKSAEYIIGITGDELLKNKKFAELVQPWELRARNVIVFLARLLQLSDRGWKGGAGPAIEESDGDFRAAFRNDTIRVQCVRIQDAFGPTITVEKIDALAVSGETRSGGRAVNDRRVQQGWHELTVFEVDVLDAEEVEDTADGPTRTDNFAAKISSSAIRQRKAQQLKPETKI